MKSIIFLTIASIGQILIRGIVGTSYTSDVAIDDVSVIPLGKKTQVKLY